MTPTGTPFSGFARKFHQRVVVPFLQSEAPIPQVSWGAAIGMFVGLTPTMGIQMYIVAGIWAICRFLLRLRFNLPIAVAMVWISNPVTVLPFYYVFFLTGELFLTWGDGMGHLMDYAAFQEAFVQAGTVPTESWFVRLTEGIILLFWTFGWPMIVGSLVWAIPASLATYPVTTFWLLRYRWLNAAREGLTYQEWKRKHIHPD